MRINIFTWPIDLEVIKDIFAYIILATFASVFFIYLLNKDKLDEKINAFLERYVWKYIHYGIGYPLFMFLMLSSVKYTANSSDEDFLNQFCLLAVMFYFIVAFFCIYGLMEKFGVYVSQRMTFAKFLVQIFMSLLSIVLCFGFSYNALYYYDNSMFSSVVNDGIFGEALQFVYYSFEIMFNTEVSDIKAENYWSQGVNILESLTSFLVIVILIANYENIGKMFKEDNKLPMDSNVQENKETDN